MRRTIVLISGILFLFVFQLAFAQTDVIDSLELRLTQATGDERVVTMILLAEEYGNFEFDKSIEKTLGSYFEKYQTVSLENFKIDDDEIVEHGNGKIVVQPCM